MDAIFQTTTGRRSILMRIGEVIKSRCFELWVHGSLPALAVAEAVEGKGFNGLGTGASGGNLKEFMKMVNVYLDKQIPIKLDEARAENIENYWTHHADRALERLLATGAADRRLEDKKHAMKRAQMEARAELPAIQVLHILQLLGQAIIRDLPPKQIIITAPEPSCLMCGDFGIIPDTSYCFFEPGSFDYIPCPCCRPVIVTEPVLKLSDLAIPF